MIPVATLRVYCGVEGEDEEDDAILTALDAAAVDQLTIRTGRYWGLPQTGVVYYIDGMARGEFFVEDGNLSSISVSLRPSISSDYESFDSTDYAAIAQPGGGTLFQRVDGVVWPSGAGAIRITANRGYAEASTAVPLLIQQAVKDYVNFMFRPGRQSVLSERAATLDQIPNWTQAIESYRVPAYG